MSVVLMYHALYANDDTSSIDSDDLPYAVSESDFIEQMEFLKAYSVGLWSETNLPEVIITFDDGHVSNHDIALPILKELGFKAYFFVTSDFVGNRTGFCQAEHLQNLVREEMVIGSHGQTHRFFDDLANDEAIAELDNSKRLLERITGKDIQSLSFPGGRFNSETLRHCAGKRLFLLFGSEFGRVRPTGGGQVVNRIAIRRNTSIEEFKQIIEQDQKYYFTQTAKYRCKQVLKRVLGNQHYHGLYKLLSRR